MRDVSAQELDGPGHAGAAAEDREGACEDVARLEGLTKSHNSGRHLIQAVGVGAVFGLPWLAVDALQRACAAGVNPGAELRAGPMLRPLSDRPEFPELLRLSG